MSEGYVYEPGEINSTNRRSVPPSVVTRVIADVAQEYGVAPDVMRNTRRRGKRLTQARREAWRRLAKPNIAVISIARAWPCDHTTILHGLGVTNQDRKRWGECSS